MIVTSRSVISDETWVGPGKADSQLRVFRPVTGGYPKRHAVAFVSRCHGAGEAYRKIRSRMSG